MKFHATLLELTVRIATCRKVRLAILTNNGKVIYKVLLRVISRTYLLEFKIMQLVKHFKGRAMQCKYSGRHQTIIMTVN